MAGGDREKIIGLIGPRQALGVNTEAASAKSRQESRMEPGEQKTHPAAVWRSPGGYQDQTEDDAERIDRIAAAKLEDATEGI